MPRPRNCGRSWPDRIAGSSSGPDGHSAQDASRAECRRGLPCRHAAPHVRLDERASRGGSKTSAAQRHSRACGNPGELLASKPDTDGVIPTHAGIQGCGTRWSVRRRCHCRACGNPGCGLEPVHRTGPAARPDGPCKGCRRPRVRCARARPGAAHPSPCCPWMPACAAMTLHGGMKARLGLPRVARRSWNRTGRASPACWVRMTRCAEASRRIRRSRVSGFEEEPVVAGTAPEQDRQGEPCPACYMPRR